MRRLWLLCLLAAVCGAAFQPVAVAAAGTWTMTGSMANARADLGIALLPNGKVLVVGGEAPGGTIYSSAELYDPATGAWSPTGSTAVPRAGHTATVLPSGKVLVVGGLTANVAFSATNTAELYDPATGVFTPTGPMSVPREGHSATLLPNGKVLIAGGDPNYSPCYNSAELYDPATGLFTPTGSLNWPRRGPAALLANGKVLAAGSSGCSNHNSAVAELYDPATATWSLTGSLNVPRADEGMVALPNGKALIAGGIDATPGSPTYGTSSAKAELYDPATGSWTLTGNLNVARSFFGMSADYSDLALLPNGQVLIDGGWDGSRTLSSAELYDPATGSWTLTGSLNSVRKDHRTIALQNGNALAVGGSTDASGTLLASAEIFQACDLTLAVAVTPSAATTGMMVSVTGSLTNNSDSSQVVTVKTVFTYVSPGGTSFPAGTFSSTFTMTAHQTISNSAEFVVTSSTPRGTYHAQVTASDASGSTSKTVTFTVY